MPHLSVAAIECLRIHTVEVAHQPRQVRAAGVQYEVIVIVYQLVGQHLCVKELHSLLHYAEQRRTVAVIIENRFAAVAAGGDLAIRNRKLDSQGARHGRRVAGVGAKGKT